MAKDKNKGFKLEETRGKFKVVGVVQGIENENAYREGFTKDEREYKSLSFFVQTSKENRVKVELFGMVRDEVYAYSQKDKKSKKVSWDKRYDDLGSYKVMGTSISIDGNRKVLVEYDAIDYILENIKDGDVVRVNGVPDYQEFEGDNGEKRQSTRFNINSITKIDEELDFESEDFKETSFFEQDIVISDVMRDDESDKLLISAFIIKYGDKVVPTTFTVDTEKYPKLAKNMEKRLKFGDFLKVYGKIINATIYEKGEVEDDDDWGGDGDIQSEFNYVKNHISEIQITSVDSKSYEKKKYTEDDLISEEEGIFDGDVDLDDNSFDDDSDDDDENLPFD